MSETFEVSVSCTLTIRGRFSNVKQIEAAIRAEVQRGARQLMVQTHRQAQQCWLAQRRERYVSQRWRSRHYLTAWGPVVLPTLVVRERQRARGGYHNVFVVAGSTAGAPSRGGGHRDRYRDPAVATTGATGAAAPLVWDALGAA